MAETYTQTDMDMATSRLAVEAKVCGILQRNETLYYTKAGTGVPAKLEIKRGVDGGWQYLEASWLPKFTIKDNKRTQYKMIFAAVDALRAASDVMLKPQKDAQAGV